LPFADDYFDGIWSLQMNMNVEDKQGWLQEACRVLKPGERAVLYEVCGGKNTPLHYPVPWAQDASMSFLVPPESFRELIASAGFDIEVWNDKTELARKAFADAKKPGGAPNLPVLGVYLLVGDDIQTKAWNLHRNLESDSVSLIEAVISKPARTGH
jgi:SAM-dependent methyltransferase